ncbi:DUF2550 domain-containing protein [Cellulomonas composti]|uniref:DUF2550 domain-containing protein n=1 Tax=Cellulomonas composti TaxID=266130 RepID=A0A511JC83_9CELL|nr:DUF2550 domain-containing protein [Cellulomonas composti]GEL95594.1 hypothetical protein CCO02nite_22520 [Cellulomonas composti]
MHGLGVVAIVALVVVLVVVACLWLSRTSTLARRVGAFRCRLRGVDGHGWSSGVAQYGADRLYWWRHWSLAPRPARRWERSGLAIVDRRPSTEDPGLLAVTCQGRSGGRDVEVTLAMSPEAFAGLTSWIEATPLRVGSVI